jgi:putative oxidoreductase
MASVSRSDIARLVLRVGVGGVMAAHGTQKLFGWFGGGGLTGTAGHLESAGFRPGRLNAIVAGVTETVGGVLLAAGLATPSTGAAVTSTMAVAAATHAPQGFFAMKGGYEYPAVLGLASGALALAGAGKLSLDELLHQRLGGGRLALFSAVVTAGATALVLRRRQAALAEQTAVTASAVSTENVTTVTTGPVTPPSPGEPATSPLPGATGQADNGPVEA